MHRISRLWLCLIIWLVGTVPGVIHAQPTPQKPWLVQAVLYEVPETTWQTQVENKPAAEKSEGLRELLVKMVAEKTATEGFAAQGPLTEHAPWLWRRGENVSFVESWEVNDKSVPVPAGRSQKFVGSRLEVSLLAAGRQVLVKVEHHPDTPDKQRIFFANAAEGAERDKFFVEYPAFQKVEWEGAVETRPNWKLVFNALQPGHGGRVAKRHIMFIRCTPP